MLSTFPADVAAALVDRYGYHRPFDAARLVRNFGEHVRAAELAGAAPADVAGQLARVDHDRRLQGRVVTAPIVEEIIAGARSSAARGRSGRGAR